MVGPKEELVTPQGAVSVAPSFLATTGKWEAYQAIGRGKLAWHLQDLTILSIMQGLRNVTMMYNILHGDKSLDGGRQSDVTPKH